MSCLWLLAVVAMLVEATEMTTATTPSDLLPSGWAEICSPVPLSASDLNASFVCRVTRKDRVKWKLVDLRKSLAPWNATGVKASVEVTCENGAQISLPWPMRAPGLVELRVRGCTLLDKYIEMEAPAESQTDSLRVLDLQDCQWVLDSRTMLLLLLRMGNLSSDYNCGQDSSFIQYIYRNISDRFADEAESQASPSNDVTLTDNAGGEASNLSKNTSQPDTSNQQALLAKLERISSDPGQAFKDALQKIDNNPSTCDFEKLEVLDESQASNFAKKHFEVMVKNKFPRLRIMNYSYVGLTSVASQLKEWSRFFEKLELIDLTGNHIPDVSFEYPYPADVNMTLRLHYNNISKISVDILENWAHIPKLFVDIRHNPINCTCELRDLLVMLKNATAWPGPALTYYRSYVPDLTCSTPLALKGRSLASLLPNELPCPVAPADLRPAMAALAVVALALLVLLVLAVRYRREVRILVFTRAHVLLPCGLPLANVDEKHAARKTYDAFVAYAHEDSEWVIQELCHKLENSVSRSPSARRLCIHQRDFVVGKTIIDNIIDSIAASRHTIVVVSPSFVKSAWAMEELQQAFRQSLEERRRHLVIVMLKEVQQSDMPPVLKRCCKTFTYLEADDSLFWDRLQFSLLVTEKKSVKLEANDNSEDDRKEEKDGAKSSIDEEFRKALFSETMRTISVDSSNSVFSCTSDDRQLVTPSPTGSRVIGPPFRF